MKKYMTLIGAVVLTAVATFGITSVAQSNREVTADLCATEHSSPAGDFVTKPQDISGDGVADTCVLDNYFGSNPGVGSALKMLRDAHQEEYEQYLNSVNGVTPAATPAPTPTPAPPADIDWLNWYRLPESTDALTGDTRTAVSTGDTDSFSVVGDGFGSDASLYIRCTNNTGRLEVYISFREDANTFGDYIYVAGLGNGLSVTYKFDDGPLLSETWNESTDNEAVFQQRQNVSNFVQNIRNSEQLTIRVTDFSGDYATMVFDIRWFEEIVLAPNASNGLFPLRNCL